MTIVLSGMFVLPIMRRLCIRSIPEFLELATAGRCGLSRQRFGRAAVHVSRRHPLCRSHRRHHHHGLEQFPRLAHLFSILSILYS